MTEALLRVDVLEDLRHEDGDARAGFEESVRGDASASVDEVNERIALDYLERVRGLDVVRAPE